MNSSTSSRTSQAGAAGERSGKRIVLTTFGSLGDLHPYMAIALGLQARGHQTVLATSGMYRQKVEEAGLGFHGVRPHFEGDLDIKNLIRRGMELKSGPEYIIRELVIKPIRDSYADLDAVAKECDLLVTHPLTFAGPLIAEKRGIPWISTALQPMVFFSAYDPSVLAPAQWLSRFRGLGPGFYRFMFDLARRHVRNWSDPIRRLRAEIGLPPSDADPLFEGQHSPKCVLALFSKVLAPPQPDWPPQTLVTGFPFYDRRDDRIGMDPELSAFLDAGPPPIVFTLGSAAVMDAGDFYAVSARAAQKLGQRAVLLIGPDKDNLPKMPLPPEIAVFEYAPYSEIFPRAAAIVHQGGVGTTAQALRAGRPMVIMPYSHDQPDNADRVARLGCGKVIARTRYTAERAEEALRSLLEDTRMAARAEEIGRQVQSEDGMGTACDAIEALL